MAKATPERLTKKAYETRVADVRAELVHMQVRLKNAPFPVLVVVAGVRKLEQRPLGPRQRRQSARPGPASADCHLVRLLPGVLKAPPAR